MIQNQWSVMSLRSVQRDAHFFFIDGIVIYQLYHHVSTICNPHCYFKYHATQK